MQQLKSVVAWLVWIPALFAWAFIQPHLKTVPQLVWVVFCLGSASLQFFRARWFSKPAFWISAFVLFFMGWYELLLFLEKMNQASVQASPPRYLSGLGNDLMPVYACMLSICLTPLFSFITWNEIRFERRASVLLALASIILFLLDKVFIRGGIRFH